MCSTVSASLSWQNGHFLLNRERAHGHFFQQSYSARVFWKDQFQSHPVARQFKVVVHNPLGYFAVIISDLSSPQYLGSRIISGSLQVPLFPADSSADPSTQSILKRLVDQFADPCFRCGPLIMATLP
ncbi:hypothetical protein AYI70_g309 [Smittium culicis]|uniref:Uncharacterized protein n=1 Tax=Smittium culicis TaxID=133412 RepID=A0A1R1YH81_9FUNG|nr:hypothetical protein AYI70_g309 [Smittium culicis]